MEIYFNDVEDGQIERWWKSTCKRYQQWCTSKRWMYLQRTRFLPWQVLFQKFWEKPLSFIWQQFLRMFGIFYFPSDKTKCVNGGDGIWERRESFYFKLRLVDECFSLASAFKLAELFQARQQLTCHSLLWTFTTQRMDKKGALEWMASISMTASLCLLKLPMTLPPCTWKILISNSDWWMNASAWIQLLSWRSFFKPDSKSPVIACFEHLPHREWTKRSAWIDIYILFVCCSGLPADRLFCNFQPLKQTWQLWFQNCLASIPSFACVFPSNVSCSFVFTSSRPTPALPTSLSLWFVPSPLYRSAPFASVSSNFYLTSLSPSVITLVALCC